MSASTPGWLAALASRPDVAEHDWFASYVPPEGVSRRSAVLMLFGPDPSGGEDLAEGTAVVGRLEYRQLARLAAHGALHGADDVATLAQGTQGLLSVGMDGPGAGLHLVGQAEPLQALQPADQ